MNVNLFKRNLFSYIFLGFLSGVIFGHLYFEDIILSYLFFLLGSVLLAHSTVYRKSEVGTSLFLISFFVLSFGFGVLREALVIPKPTYLLESSVEREIDMYGRIVSNPIHTEVSKKFILETGNNKVLTYVSNDEEVTYGDIILLRGKLTKPETFETESGRTFDYPSYLAKDGVLYILQFGDIKQRLGNEGWGLKKALYKVKNHTVDLIDEMLVSPEDDLLGGILLGEVGNNNLEESFRRTGLSHITVLSGYNIAVVSLFFFIILRPLQMNIKIPIVLLSILAFTVMVSSGSSTIRAAAMAFAVVVAKLVGRRISSWRSLLIAVFAMIIWNPAIIFHDPAFQLSFLATSGLIMFGNFFESHLNFIPRKFGLREIISMSLSAQVAVLPLVIYLTGYWSLVSVPANVLVLPFIAPTMFFGFLSVIFSAVSFGLFGYVTSWLLRYIIGVAEFFATITFAQVSIPEFSAYLVAFFYLIACLIYIYRDRKKTRMELESFNFKVFGNRSRSELYSQNPLPLSAS